MKKIDKTLAEFEHDNVQAISTICKLMEQRTTVDVMEIILDGLFFRNCHIFETISFQLKHNHVIGAEYLMRNLLEGTVLLEWCLVNPKERGIRFCKTVFSGELELSESGFFKQSKKHKNELQKAIACCHKALPDFRNMLNSLNTYRRDSGYELYKCLSKEAHGVGSNLEDFLDCSGKTAKVCSIITPPLNRVRQCRAIVSFLAMKNIILISSFDSSLQFGKCSNLESKWELIYLNLWIREKFENMKAK